MQPMPKRFADLTEQEILALAISSEEDDARIYGDVAERLRGDYPATAEMFEAMRAEELEHHRGLLALYRQRFGEHVPLIRRQDVKGFVRRRPIWLSQALGIDSVRKLAESMELETRQFYERSAQRVTDASTRQLLVDLAAAERKHSDLAESLAEKHLTPSAREEEAAAHRRLFVLQVVQPGLAGLMDGSVSTLAPLFAAAFATHDSTDALRWAWRQALGRGSRWASPKR
jgi:rubrerythrin